MAAAAVAVIDRTLSVGSPGATEMCLSDPFSARAFDGVSGRWYRK